MAEFGWHDPNGFWNGDSPGRECPVCGKPLEDGEKLHVGYEPDNLRVIPTVFGRGTYCEHRTLPAEIPLVICYQCGSEHEDNCADTNCPWRNKACE